MTGALDGIRVLELGTLIAGPFAGRLLGDMGAEVLKIEPPGAPDPLRTWGQAEVDGHHVFWTVHARNKKAITLDLRTEAGRALFLDLVGQSDVIVENFRPGTLEKWGLGYDVLAERNEGIILVRVSGYGQTGPDAHKAGYASVAEAASGLRHLNGFPGGPPPRMALSIGDTLAGMFAAQGALAALYRRTVTGRGQIVDTALTESCLAVQESTIPDYDVGGVVRGPSGTRLEGIAPSNIYQSADGSWVVIAANQDTVFRRLCEAMDQPELSSDERFADHVARGRNQDELDAIIAGWAAQRVPADIIDVLSAAGVIAGPINTVADVVQDPQLKAREMLVEHFDERLGRSVLGPGVVPVLSESPGGVRSAGPARPGQHNEDVYVRLLGRSAAEIESLRVQGVL
ncbi:CaiB/BaiF CoA transferase family protein [Mycobacteroides franklinii]|uniref:Succinyl-CoA:(R)-benzylsuccinate CoA-transferase subunit BbsF n=1 Tax=Mycobacteroides franklinii TaxID=948102 RepID=A0A4R8R9D8_9MYCO|nr:CoA transferase [Mycobacteroides franklinii]TDZ44315.1 Succinyl-CoA:(R)-benzylsuccinate CoA-transferase subunit BbsF [Mycobacteroides franklinii]TDZ51448.1 Succinyl-CoA:(R)-benzylsuccinate CoA-transferase subunit BbsF [Mycobacteroides franklinii]TDZ57869.1 Succinyl-CoA:(R)-benzylsuccinate CoA-transferase subunit BbsF [Mycobacteroides franklinii]TDZ64810.1 Succinyl-CoA:(R)-benzylsuccinate CoA-transferase subunit BbsF [Mycobacteroides franklinii]TDZ71208.1 Succinyl-CoA:(R)-benzylsuccinate CoA